MKIIKKTIQAKLLWYEEISQIEKDLLHFAAIARENAQAPYSHFYVGAALISKSGIIYQGCNVERATYTQTTHAEQSAIDAMVAAEGPQKITMLAIVAAPEMTQISLPPKRNILSQIPDIPIERILAPCGHCLQDIWENCFNDPTITLLSLMDNGVVSCITIDDAFPVRFGPKDLGIDYSKS